MLSKNLENSTSYDIFYKFWKKARVYYTLSISRGGGQAPGPPPGFVTDYGMKYVTSLATYTTSSFNDNCSTVFLRTFCLIPLQNKSMRLSKTE